MQEVPTYLHLHLSIKLLTVTDCRRIFSSHYRPDFVLTFTDTEIMHNHALTDALHMAYKKVRK